MRTILEVITLMGFSPRRIGALHKIPCPFHTDYDPSLVIYPETDSFWCFGCNTGGDAAFFVSKKLGISKKDAQELYIGSPSIVERLNNIKTVNPIDYERVTQETFSKIIFDHVSKNRENTDIIRTFLKDLYPIDKDMEDKPPMSYKESADYTARLNAILMSSVEEVKC